MVGEAIPLATPTTKRPKASAENQAVWLLLWHGLIAQWLEWPNCGSRAQWRTQKIFMGGFIRWHMVVICLWCAVFVTSQFDDIFMFPDQRFGEVCWHYMHILLHALPFLCVIALNINYQRSKSGYQRKISSMLRNKSSQLQNFGCVLKKGSQTHSSLLQSNLQLQNEAALVFRRIRAVEHRCAAGLAGTHPGL